MHSWQLLKKLQNCSKPKNCSRCKKLFKKFRERSRKLLANIALLQESGTEKDVFWFFEILRTIYFKGTAEWYKCSFPVKKFLWYFDRYLFFSFKAGRKFYTMHRSVFTAMYYVCSLSEFLSGKQISTSMCCNVWKGNEPVYEIM